MKKYLAIIGYSALGSVHETTDAAKKQATAYRDWNDEMTGYYKVFGKHSSAPKPIIAITDECPSRSEYVAAKADYEEDLQRFEEEVERMRKERFDKFFDLQRRYINLGTNYECHDLIRVIYRKANGRKRVVTGIVANVWITSDGEIRPKIGKVYDKPEEEIIGIEVLKRRNDMEGREIFRILHNIK